MEGGVLGKDECTDADEHDDSRDDDAVLIGSEHLAPVSIFILASLCHKDGVVVALSEDEGGENDVHHIELNIQQCHHAEDPYPADCHREEG